MKVFISSLITNMEPLRRAARDATVALGHEPIMAEEFGARPNSPQVACLEGLRQADIVVLLFGDRYGSKQASGLSATHEEYREARGSKPVLAFVQAGVRPEPDQAGFVTEVQGWESGQFRAAFHGPEDLQPAIIRALHEWQLANTVGPLDPPRLLERSLALLPRENRSYVGGKASLSVAIAGGPTQSVIRPAELEDRALADALLQAALFGEHRVFDPTKGSSKAMVGHALVLKQDELPAIVSLNEQGDISIALPVERTNQRNGLPVLIEEVPVYRRTSLNSSLFDGKERAGCGWTAGCEAHGGAGSSS